MADGVATSLRCASHWLRADHMLTVASSPLLSLSLLSASQPLAPRSLNCSQSPPSLSSTLTALFRNNMPDEATTSLRTHLPGPCLCNDQPLTVYVAASPLLSLSLCLSLPCSQPLNRRCLALAVWLCLFRSACLLCLSALLSLCLFALPLSHSAPLYLSRSASRSICLALAVSLWLSRSACFTLSTPLYLSRAACLALAVPLYLSRAACLDMPVSLYLYGCCLSRSACLALLVRSACLLCCLALPVWLCPSGSACLALQRTDTAHSP